MTTHHQAAISPGPGQPIELRTRPTPQPGPNELLIAIKSIALNPADHIMRDTGLFITRYPTVLGFDLAGLVLSVGAEVPSLEFHPGTCIAAYSALVWKDSHQDYGAFQERCLVPWQHAVVLPEENNNNSLTWNEAATLPVAVQVPLSAWDAMGLPRPSPSLPLPLPLHRKKRIKPSSSGAPPLASAAWACKPRASSAPPQPPPFAAVYATAGTPQSRAYVAALGADRVFDYRDPLVVPQIIAAAREEGLAVRHCFLAVGQLAACQAVVGAFVGDHHQSGQQVGKIASAPPVPAEAEGVDGVETVFVMPAAGEKERLAQFRDWLGLWLRENLGRGWIRPSPEVRVVGEGLGLGLVGVNAGLDELRRGVSCVKLVVEVAEQWLIGL